MSFDPVNKIIPAFVVGKICQENADELVKKTKSVNDGSLHVFFSDQRPHYKDAIPKAYGREVHIERKGTRGRFPKPKLEPPEDLLYAQVVKHRRKGRVVEVNCEIVFGTQTALQEHLEKSPVSNKINTAFVERQNNTMRQHNCRFTPVCLRHRQAQEFRLFQRRLLVRKTTASVHWLLPFLFTTRRI